MASIKRPTRHDTEEDVLRMEEEFLRDKPPLAVKLVKKPDKRKSDSGQPSSGESINDGKMVILEMSG